MIKLLFVIPEYSHGGTNKSLENLLSLIDKTKYQISVYCLYEDGGPYYKQIFSPYILKKSWLYYWLHDNVWTRKVMGGYNKLTKRDNFSFLYKREARVLQKRYNFDVVVAYQEGKTTEFVSFIDQCKNKVAWYHCPYIICKTKEAQQRALSLYGQFDKTVCVSRCFAEMMREILPTLSEKIIWIYNTVNVPLIRQMAANEIRLFDEQLFNIVSIGRLTSQKQFELIPQMASFVKSSRPFRWHIIGAGSYEQLIREKIAEFNMQDKVILMGAKDNPYPYIFHADLVVCTSDSESFSYVLAEAKCLHTPVLSNDFPVAYEVIDDSCGWIANLKEMPQVLTRIINNVDGEYDRKKASIMKYEYSNEEILQRIEELFDKK